MANEKYFKEESKKSWYTTMPVTNDDLQTGALMRIADATELMASNYVKLQNDYKYMRESRDGWQVDAERLKRSNAALRGHIKRLKHP